MTELKAISSKLVGEANEEFLPKDDRYAYTEDQYGPDIIIDLSQTYSSALHTDTAIDLSKGKKRVEAVQDEYKVCDNIGSNASRVLDGDGDNEDSVNDNNGEGNKVCDGQKIGAVSVNYDLDSNLDDDDVDKLKALVMGSGCGDASWSSESSLTKIGMGGRKAETDQSSYIQSPNDITEAEDIYECSNCALLFSSMHFLILHKGDCGNRHDTGDMKNRDDKLWIEKRGAGCSIEEVDEDNLKHQIASAGGFRGSVVGNCNSRSKPCDYLIPTVHEDRVHSVVRYDGCSSPDKGCIDLSVKKEFGSMDCVDNGGVVGSCGSSRKDSADIGKSGRNGVIPMVTVFEESGMLDRKDDGSRGVFNTSVWEGSSSSSLHAIKHFGSKPDSPMMIPPNRSTSPRQQTMLCGACYDRLHCDVLKHWHMQMHVEGRVMKCDGCGQDFSQNSVLYTHTSQAYINNGYKNNIYRNEDNKMKIVGNKRNERLCTKSVKLSDVDEERIGAEETKTDSYTAQKYEFELEEVAGTNEKKTFVCKYCNKRFRTKSDHQRHERIHTGEKPFSCHDCGRSFSDGGSFNKHRRIHTGEKPFSCPICNKAFNRKWDVNRHMTIHSRLRPYPCRLCDKSYSRKDELERHVKRHLGEEGIHKSSVEESADEEEVSVNDDENANISHVCPICRLVLGNTNDLQQHLNIHKENKNNFQCSFCDKVYTKKENLQRHIQNHTGITPFTCEICGKGLRDKSAFSHHKKVHLGVWPFTCSYCNKGFIKKEDMRRHVRVHTGERPYVCTFCGKAFSKNHDLKRHARAHTGERPYKCTICGKAFMRSGNLHTHMNIHTGAKPFRCPICTRPFTGSGDLYRHIKSHEREQMVTCSICPQGFSRVSDLDKHMETHLGQRKLLGGGEVGRLKQELKGEDMGYVDDSSKNNIKEEGVELTMSIARDIDSGTSCVSVVGSSGCEVVKGMTTGCFRSAQNIVDTNLVEAVASVQ